jgi:hypothetical protein
MPRENARSRALLWLCSFSNDGAHVAPGELVPAAAGEGYTLAQLLNRFLCADGTPFNGIEQLRVACPALGFSHAFGHRKGPYVAQPAVGAGGVGAGGGGVGEGDFFADDAFAPPPAPRARGAGAGAPVKLAAAAPLTSGDENVVFAVDLTKTDPNLRARRVGRGRVPELNDYKMQACAVREIEAWNDSVSCAGWVVRDTFGCVTSSRSGKP